MNLFRLCLFFLAPILLHGHQMSVPTYRYKGFPDVSNHPGHYPFISHLTFRNMCDIVIDQSTEWFDPDSVKKGDLVYVNVWYLEWFAKHVHEHIKHPYILVSGDTGGWLPEQSAQKLLHDPKLAAWFCRNIVFSYHPKLFQLPMGQDFALFTLDRGVENPLIEAISKMPYPKKHLLYMNFFPRPHGDRDKIAQDFENKPYCFTRNHSSKKWVDVPRPLFYEEMASSVFALSPLGLETDCVRTWEAFVLNCIPIVEHTFLDPIYQGLPVVLVHDYAEIDQAFLEKKYQELKGQKFYLEKAYFDYWRDLIKETQNKVRNNELSFAQLEATKFTPKEIQDLRAIINGSKFEDTLIYKGFLSAIRPLQLAKFCPTLQNIFLYDPWLNQKEFQNFDRYLSDRSLLRKQKNIIFIPNEDRFNNFIEIGPICPVFLDLTYYRTSLRIDFTKSVCTLHNFRHSLKQDLTDLNNRAAKEVTICGNMHSDPYVKEVLDAFSREQNVEIHTRGSFWFFTKK